MGKIRVGIIGVGNCASSLIQGVEYYKNAKESDTIPGVMHVNLGGYHIRDIEFVSAFDIDKNKVGKNLSEAIFTPPNNTTKFARVSPKKVRVERGMTHDGLGKYLSRIIHKAPGSTADVIGILKDTKTDVVINYLPVGSEEATKWYIEQVLKAKCAFINCIPVFIASEPYWQRRFAERNLPIIGDDVKSQVGATILHRTLVNLYLDRGMPIDRTYQLNTRGKDCAPRKYQRQELLRLRLNQEALILQRRTSILAPVITSPGRRTTRSVSCASKAVTSGICPPTWTAGYPSRTPRIQREWSSMPSDAVNWPSTTASPERSLAPRPIS